jgi:hypothetical protein
MAYQETLAPRIQEILEELSEHFDSIQILGSFMEENGDTGKLSMGKGNWYARQGICREFLEQDTAATNAYELSKVICQEDEED